MKRKKTEREKERDTNLYHPFHVNSYMMQTLRYKSTETTLKNKKEMEKN